jgi:glutamate synthase domain-containing protein 3
MAVPPSPVLAVNEIRDYERINVELAQWLHAGHAHVRLTGVDGQRLLASGLAGAWSAVIEIEGNAGPELAAGLDAPGLVVVTRGSAADGVGRGLRQGRLLILGDAADATGYRQAGGVVMVAGATGHRAGLELEAGTLVLGGPTGRLLGDRQAGGRILALGTVMGAHAGHGRRGGRLIAPRVLGVAADRPFVAAPDIDRPTRADFEAYYEAIRNLVRWLPPDLTSVNWPEDRPG